eukprot:TRINITY_DN16456_c0_g1_i1.p1 TRINITY_DN16456_c0_g1~~TRINITY_DN16456_c0_g1_i1.p1  ORF type:complete len:2502 (+),score=532.42 TRINITY_DN16456_c0_g1_i1:67-7572(+)
MNSGELMGGHDDEDLAGVSLSAAFASGEWQGGDIWLEDPPMSDAGDEEGQGNGDAEVGSARSGEGDAESGQKEVLAMLKSLSNDKLTDTGAARLLARCDGSSEQASNMICDLLCDGRLADLIAFNGVEEERPEQRTEEAPVSDNSEGPDGADTAIITVDIPAAAAHFPDEIRMWFEAHCAAVGASVTATVSEPPRLPDAERKETGGTLMRWVARVSRTSGSGEKRWLGLGRLSAEPPWKRARLSEDAEGGADAAGSCAATVDTTLLRRFLRNERRAGLQPGVAHDALRAAAGNWTLSGAGPQWGYTVGPVEGSRDVVGAARAVLRFRREQPEGCQDASGEGSVLNVPSCFAAPPSAPRPAAPHATVTLTATPQARGEHAAKAAARVAASKIAVFTMELSPEAAAAGDTALNALGAAVRRRWADTVLCVHGGQGSATLTAMALGMGAQLAAAWLADASDALQRSPRAVHIGAVAAAVISDKSGCTVASPPPQWSGSARQWEYRCVKRGGTSWQRASPTDAITLAACTSGVRSPLDCVTLGAKPGVLFRVRSTSEGSGHPTAALTLTALSGGHSLLARPVAGADSVPVVRRGDWVRVRASADPKHAWGRVQRCDVGRVMDIQGTECVVRFRAESAWQGCVPDMERVAKPPSPPVPLQPPADPSVLSNHVDVTDLDSGRTVRFSVAPSLPSRVTVKVPGCPVLSGDYRLLKATASPVWLMGPKTCPKGHKLQRSVISTEWSCTHCTTVAVGDKLTCKHCAFDLCDDCYSGELPPLPRKDGWVAPRSREAGPADGRIPGAVWEHLTPSGWMAHSMWDCARLEAVHGTLVRTVELGAEGAVREVSVNLRTMTQTDRESGEETPVRRREREAADHPLSTRIAGLVVRTQGESFWMCKCGMPNLVGVQECRACSAPREVSEALRSGEDGEGDAEARPDLADVDLLVGEEAAGRRKSAIEEELAWSHLADMVQRSEALHAEDASANDFGRCILFNSNGRWVVQAIRVGLDGVSDPCPGTCVRSAAHDWDPPNKVEWEGGASVQLPTTSPIEVCPRGHSLSPREPKGKFCSRCRLPTVAGTMVWTCQKHCDLQLCGGCFAEGVPLCLAGHAMCWSDYAEDDYKGGWLCDNSAGCDSSRGVPHVMRWFCHRCRVEYCGRCCGRAPGVRCFFVDADGGRVPALNEWSVRSATWFRDGRLTFPDSKSGGFRFAGPELPSTLWQIREIAGRAGASTKQLYDPIPAVLCTDPAWLKPTPVPDGLYRRDGKPPFIVKNQAVQDLPTSVALERDSDGAVVLWDSRVVFSDGRRVEMENGDVYTRCDRILHLPSPGPGEAAAAGARRILSALWSRISPRGSGAPAGWVGVLGPPCGRPKVAALLMDELDVRRETLRTAPHAVEVARSAAQTLARLSGLRSVQLVPHMCCLRVQGTADAISRARRLLESLIHEASIAAQRSRNAYKIVCTAEAMDVAEVRIPCPASVKASLFARPAPGRAEQTTSDFAAVNAAIKQLSAAAAESRAQVLWASFDDYADEVRKALRDGGVELPDWWQTASAQLPSLRQGQPLMLRRPQVGDRVRISPHLAVSAHDRELEALRRAIKSEDPGIVSSVGEHHCLVNFSRHRGWRASPGEIEIESGQPPQDQETLNRHLLPHMQLRPDAPAAPEQEEAPQWDWPGHVVAVQVALSKEGWPRAWCHQVHKWMTSVLDPMADPEFGRPTVLCIGLRAPGGRYVHVVCPSSTLTGPGGHSKADPAHPIASAAHDLLRARWAHTCDGYLLEEMRSCLSEDRVHPLRWHQAACLRGLRRCDELRAAAKRMSMEAIDGITRAEESASGPALVCLQQLKRMAEDNMKEWEEVCARSEFDMRGKCERLRQKFELSEQSARRRSNTSSLLTRMENTTGAVIDFDPASDSIVITGTHPCVDRARRVLQPLLCSGVLLASHSSVTLRIPQRVADVLSSSPIKCHLVQHQVGLSEMSIDGTTMKVSGTAEQVKLLCKLCSAEPCNPEPTASQDSDSDGDVTLLCGHSIRRSKQPPRVCPVAGCQYRLVLTDLAAASAAPDTAATESSIQSSLSADPMVRACRCGGYVYVIEGSLVPAICVDCGRSSCVKCGEAPHPHTPCAGGRKRKRSSACVKEEGEDSEVPCAHCPGVIRRKGSRGVCERCLADCCWRCLAPCVVLSEAADRVVCKPSERAQQLAHLHFLRRARLARPVLRAESSCAACGERPLQPRFSAVRQCSSCWTVLLCARCKCPHDPDHDTTSLPLVCPRSQEDASTPHALLPPPHPRLTAQPCCCCGKQAPAHLACPCGYRVCAVCADEGVLYPGEQAKAVGVDAALAVPEIGTRTHVVLHNGWVYSTLADVDPCGHTVTTQATSEPLPRGWELVPDDPSIRAAVIAPRTWCTHMVVLAGGLAYKTGYYRGGAAGTLWRQDCIVSDESGYRPSFSSGHILIRSRWTPPAVPAEAVWLDEKLWAAALGTEGVSADGRVANAHEDSPPAQEDTSLVEIVCGVPSCRTEA